MGRKKQPIVQEETPEQQDKNKLKVARAKGWNAWTFKEGETNPYEEGTQEHALFAQGYNAAKNQYGEIRNAVHSQPSAIAATDFMIESIIRGQSIGVGIKPLTSAPLNIGISVKRGRGRPKGSKNKVKK